MIDDATNPAPPDDDDAPLSDPASDPAPDPAAERDACRDRLQRTLAEFDNYRKRIDGERADMARAAAGDLIAALLPLVDDFERALAAPPEATDAAAYRAGIELIHRKMQTLLRERGVTPIEAVGTRFDPHLHDAVTCEASGDHADGEVIAEIRRGYRLGRRLLRPAMVTVAKG